MTRLTITFTWLGIAAFLVSDIVLAQQAVPTCTRIEYIELKEMRPERLQRALCSVADTQVALKDRLAGSLGELRASEESRGASAIS